MKHFLLFAALILLAPTLLFATRPCKKNPFIVGACRTVHGRASFGAGAPQLKIWPANSSQVLGVTAGPKVVATDAPICPPNMLAFFEDGGDFTGDFEVCPFTPPQKGQTQLVCVESARHLKRAKR